MNVKSHPEYWNTHKTIWQEEYDNLDSLERERVMNQPESNDATGFNNRVDKLVERKLLSPVE